MATKEDMADAGVGPPELDPEAGRRGDRDVGAPRGMLMEWMENPIAYTGRR
jgi:hypothetical protein